MNKTCENHLRTIQTAARENGPGIFSSSLNINEFDLNYLAAKNLIEIIPWGDNEFEIALAKPGITYFDDKSERRRAFVVDHLMKFTVGFASGVVTTLLATWLLQVL